MRCASAPVKTCIIAAKHRAIFCRVCNVNKRPSGGCFYCPSFPSQSYWTLRPDGTTVAVAFGSYGNYEFAVTDAVLREFSGAAIVDGAPAPAHWRRMRCIRSLSPVETRMLGATGAGSQWSFQWAGGAFPVEFRGDGCAPVPLPFPLSFYCREARSISRKSASLVSLVIVRSNTGTTTSFARNSPRIVTGP